MLTNLDYCFAMTCVRGLTNNTTVMWTVRTLWRRYTSVHTAAVSTPPKYFSITSVTPTPRLSYVFHWLWTHRRISTHHQ